MKTLPEWERVLTAACRLQQLVPDAVLVGGTGAAIHAQHRQSHDADHVITDLRQRFDEILVTLESVAGWKTARIQRPVQILGSLDGIETGIRQLIRAAPLETEQIDLGGNTVTVPTQAEMLRIKAWLILTRNATRDYIDFTALALHLGQVTAVAALSTLDQLYPQNESQSALQQLMKQLAEPRPYDLQSTNLAEYRELRADLHDWNTITTHCRRLSVALMEAQAAKGDIANTKP